MTDFGYMMTIGLSVNHDFVATTKHRRVAPLQMTKYKPHQIPAAELPILLYQLVMAGYLVVKDDRYSDQYMTIIAAYSKEYSDDQKALIESEPK
jgi:hypothetical protein